jgi:hypothetical protein
VNDSDQFDGFSAGSVKRSGSSASASPWKNNSPEIFPIVEAARTLFKQDPYNDWSLVSRCHCPIALEFFAQG